MKNLAAFFICSSALLAHGQDLDPTWGTGGMAAYVPDTPPTQLHTVRTTSDGKVLACDLNTVVRFLADGSLDPAWGEEGSAVLPQGLNNLYDMALLPDGRVVGCAAQLTASNNIPVLYCLLPDGTPDLAFGNGGIATLPGPYPIVLQRLSVNTSGDILACGFRSMPDFDLEPIAARCGPDGQWDPAFNIDGLYVYNNDDPDGLASGCVLLDDGSAVLTGSVTTSGPVQGLFLIKLTATGTPDPSFATAGIYTHGPGSFAEDITRAPNGDLIMAGTRPVPSVPESEGFVLRLNANGVPVEAFGDGGQVVFQRLPNTMTSFTDVLARSDGSILLTLRDDATNVMALGPDGEQVMGLGTDGYLDPGPVLGFCRMDLDDQGRLYMAAGETSAGNGVVLRFASGTIGMAEAGTEEVVQVFPQPANDVVTVLLPGMERGSVAVLDAAGRTVTSTSLTPAMGPITLDTSALSAGRYILRFTDGSASLAAPLIVAR